MLYALGVLLEVLGFLIFARALVSWFPIDRNGAVVRALDQITEPILEPLRRIIPPIGMIDITPMLAMFFFFIVGGMLMQGSGT